jgi:predicted DNA-binding protein (MmcQ/YjbR family)
MTRRADKPTGALARAEQAIARTAASFPEVVEDNPWGHRAFKVRSKAFLFLASAQDGLSLSVKLPESGEAALALLFTEPTGYGLGKSGWVTARFDVETSVPLPLIEQWLEESYRAIAPKKLAATLGGVQAAAHKAKRPQAAAPKTKEPKVKAAKPTAAAAVRGKRRGKSKAS